MSYYVPLFQEGLKAEGREWRFWMLVGCILANKTQWRQAEPVFYRLQREVGRTQWAVSVTKLREVEGIIKPLGLHKGRALSIVRLAREFDRHLLYGKEGTWPRIEDLPGCGPYAAASWSIFVLERRAVETRDARLREYLDRTAWG